MAIVFIIIVASQKMAWDMLIMMLQLGDAPVPWSDRVWHYNGSSHAHDDHDESNGPFPTCFSV